MICINCLASDTTIINSRPRRNDQSVWRRRKCKQCGFIATSDEHIVLDAIYTVSNVSGSGSMPFSTVALIASIQDALENANTDSSKAYWLALTVTENIVKGYRPTTPLGTNIISEEVFKVLKNYHHLAATIYAAKHNVAIKRAGRPRKS